MSWATFQSLHGLPPGPSEPGAAHSGDGAQPADGAPERASPGGRLHDCIFNTKMSARSALAKTCGVFFGTPRSLISLFWYFPLKVASPKPSGQVGDDSAAHSGVKLSQRGKMAMGV